MQTAQKSLSWQERLEDVNAAPAGAKGDGVTAKKSLQQRRPLQRCQGRLLWSCKWSRTRAAKMAKGKPHLPLHR